MAELVSTSEIIKWLRTLRNASGDIDGMTAVGMDEEEYYIVEELTSLIFNTAITVEQQIAERDKLIKALYDAALDISICLEEYQQATHNYSGMSDEDRHIYDDIDKAEAKLRDLNKRIKEITSE